MATCAPILSTQVDNQRRTGAARFHWMLAALASFEAIIAVCLIPERLDGPVSAVPGLLLVTAAPAAFCWLLDYERAKDTFLAFGWVCVFGILAGPLVELAARSRFPLVDSNLGRLDCNLTVIVVRCARECHVASIFRLVYSSLKPLCLGALLMLSVRGLSERAYHFVLAGAIGLLLTIATFAILPAVGPWMVEGYQPDKLQALVASELIALKAGHTGASPLESTAIVSFPSFHTILAILSASALWPICWLRWPAAVLAAGICVSTLTTGWHYGVDIVAGALVAIIAQRMARVILA